MRRLNQRLLSMLETELAQETGSIILKHEKRIAEQCDATAREMLLTALHRYAAAHTAESHDQHGGHPQRRNEGADHRP